MKDPVISQVVGLVSDSSAQQMVKKHGLGIMNVAWEDTARFKNSSVGPNISDMTLLVSDTPMPLIRAPNFSDKTCDFLMESIPLNVGNDRDLPLSNVSLAQYLQNISNYTDLPEGTNLYAPERDSHCITSVQACFLPVPKSEEATFNVSIYNYQSTHDHPAVLVIVATSQGTSAQIINNATGFRGQKLFFNKNMQKCSFVGERLKDNRIKRGVSTEGEMTSQEKQDNVILIIQVPLEVPQMRFAIPTAPMSNMFYCEDAMPMMAPSYSLKKCAMPSRGGGNFRSRSAAPDVDHAIVRVGESEGAYPSLSSSTLKRDHRYPVRMTVQFYKATSNGVVDQGIVDEIAVQMSEVVSRGQNFSSLVVEGNTHRPTEPVLTSSSKPTFFFGPPPVPVPAPFIPPPVIYAPPPVVANPKYFYCDGCNRDITHELRYHCTACPDFDFCKSCETKVPHLPGHAFLKIQPPVVKPPVPVVSFVCSSCRGRFSGARYRCTVCPNYLLCMGCEKKNVPHNSTHPFLKLL